FELDRSIKKDLNALPIVSSRGCPFDCIYCPVKCSIGGFFRARSPQSIIEELTYWYEKGYRRFSFADDNFTLLKERVYSLCELLEAGKLSQIKLSCDNGIRADCVDRDLLKYMKKVGFYRIAIGAEAGNDKILRNLRKKEDIVTIKKTIGDACDLGYEVNLFFLVGSPGETFQDLQDSFKITEDYPIGTAHFYNPIPFPNTPLFDWINENGRFLTDPEEYLNNYPILDNKPVFETSEMPYKERKKAISQAFGVTRKTMRRNWTRRLAKLGPLGKVLAFIYSSKVTQDVILRNRFCRVLVYKLARKVVSY
nr:radical SAM protein [Deltaproteobacteria bacterium]